MTERRLLAPSLPPDGGAVRLGEGAAKHARVLRLAVGDAVVLFDGEGAESDATIEALDARSLACRAGPRRVRARVGPRVVLCQALPKGNKLESLVRACTEAGVDAIRFFVGERSVAKPGDDRFEHRLERLERIASEAARQATRADVPRLHPLARLDAVLEDAEPNARKLVAVVGAEPLAQAPADVAWIVVGPEGGLTPSEIARAVAAGFSPAGLGPYALRVETAAPIACALVRASCRG
ncbi:MAG: 16S rRNA (uracil(1498)-N(3))-methyltransferase [Sandaracinaceae bacterium]